MCNVSLFTHVETNKLSNKHMHAQREINANNHLTLKLPRQKQLTNVTKYIKLG